MSTPVSIHDAFAEYAPEVMFRVVNRVALITLSRPAAFNPRSHGMVRELAALLERCRNNDGVVAVVLRGTGENGFSAVDDVRALYDMAAQRDAWLPFFVDKYRLGCTVHTFPKPIVTLMDCPTMCGGMGLVQGAALRVATERSKIALTGTRIGLVPDLGAMHFLSRMPVELELYVGLTGAPLSGADTLSTRLADLCVPSSWLGTFETRIEHANWNGDLLAVLRKVFEPPCNVVPHAALDSRMTWIARHFDRRSTVARIVATLKQDLARDELSREYRQWLQATLDALVSHSPAMLCVMREALLRGRKMTLADSFRMELGIVARAIEDGDFREGARAYFVDRDCKPCWTYTSIDETRAERVRHLLVSPWTPATHPLADLKTA
ncbi:enoyl-CoA hydratase/isomerase family protein [Burkholderia cepacia]|uniref:enoyl-CoA hydratase/isomerase family protein n=1 Tax=Burkholderia cepacia TaxID=292 RepID=UPI000F5D65B0|nr:enoyl-CoA hydratase/isomerase family protein [Burkholderia cepacia]RQZ89685.1 enoyl-CoA hydratase/isomerase family protein [Burkholderia cepacia]RQZ95234.1 enoyl-CoA hydratase/isomerase family protein [Burkholderia cepacia]